ncbi:hypothetical protein PIB30_066748, partial [Stylosanthes scabra]|nr:hypothetical protein [Stylosanthes scabra]
IVLLGPLFLVGTIPTSPWYYLNDSVHLPISNASPFDKDFVGILYLSVCLRVFNRAKALLIPNYVVDSLNFQFANWVTLSVMRIDGFKLQDRQTIYLDGSLIVPWSRDQFPALGLVLAYLIRDRPRHVVPSGHGLFQRCQNSKKPLLP